MRMGAVFGRLLVVGAMATAVFALAAPTGMLPTAVAQRNERERDEDERGRHGDERERHDRDPPGPESAEMREIVEVLRREGFSEPHSVEREHGVIEVEATGRDGRRYEVTIDPRTGKILEKEEDD